MKYHKSNPIPEALKAKIVLLYKNGLSTLKISKLLNVNQPSVYYIIKDRIKMRTASECSRKIPINENFFDEINTPSKAYVLGLIMADGSICKNSYVLKIDLEEKDKHILQDISKLIYNKIKIYGPYFYKKKNKIHYKVKIKNHNPIIRFQVQSKHIHSKLKDYGITYKKTYDLTFPKQIKKSLLSHFVRGYFDGDGYLSILKRGNSTTGRVGMDGTKKFLTILSERIRKQLKIKTNLRTKYKNTNFYTFDLWNTTEILKFMKWMYKGSGKFKLRRKYKIYQKLKFIKG